MKVSAYVSVIIVLSTVFLFFFFKQKTSNEMRISEWMSDVCSSDLIERLLHLLAVGEPGQLVEARHSCDLGVRAALLGQVAARTDEAHEAAAIVGDGTARDRPPASGVVGDRKSTRLNSSH